MDMRQCDVCGALESADKEPPVGSAYLQVIRRPSERDFVSSFFGRGHTPTDTYHLCADCARMFVEQMRAGQEMRRA